MVHGLGLFAVGHVQSGTELRYMGVTTSITRPRFDEKYVRAAESVVVGHVLVAKKSVHPARLSWSDLGVAWV